MQPLTFQQTPELGGETYALGDEELLVSESGMGLSRVLSRVRLSDLSPEPIITHKRFYLRSAVSLVLAIGTILAALLVKRLNVPELTAVVVGFLAFGTLTLLWIAFDGLRPCEGLVFANQDGSESISIFQPKKGAAFLAYEEFIPVLRDRIRSRQEG